MIVISSALALSPAYHSTAWAPVIGWQTLVAANNITADSEDEDYPASNLANPNTVLLWKSAGTDEQHLTAELNTSDPVDYLAIARHNFGSSGATISVEGLGAEDDAVWEELCEGQVLADDAPVLFRFTPAMLDQIRLKIVPDGVAPQAAVLFAGKLLVMDRGLSPSFTPIGHSAESEAVDNLSQGGEYLGSVILSETHSSTADFRGLDPDWYRASMEPFRRRGKGAAFFFAWAPKDYPDEVAFCWLTNSPRPVVGQAPGWIDITLQYAGVVD